MSQLRFHNFVVEAAFTILQVIDPLSRFRYKSSHAI